MKDWPVIQRFVSAISFFKQPLPFCVYICLSENLPDVFHCGVGGMSEVGCVKSIVAKVVVDNFIGRKIEAFVRCLADFFHSKMKSGL